MQEFRLDAEETVKLRKKYLGKSSDQARLQRQREKALKAKQQTATTIDPSTVTFDDDDDVGDDREIHDSSDEIVSDSADDSASENQKVTLNKTILILAWN